MVKVTGAVADWLVQKEVIEETQKELYEYAVYSVLLLFAPLLLSTAIGSLFGEFAMSFVLIFPFMCIRKFSGGYHAKSQWSCLAISSLLLGLCFWVAEYIVVSTAFSIIVFVAAVSLAIFSPIDSENHRLQEDEQISYRKTCRILVLLFLFCYVVLLLLRAYQCAVYMAMGLILSAGLQIPCILQKVKRIM